LSGGVYVSPLPCASWPALLGEAAMRHKDQLRRWGEVPRSGEGPHLSYQLILPPLPTGPNQTLTRGTSRSCHSSDLLLKFASPLKAIALNDGRTISFSEAEILRTI